MADSLFDVALDKVRQNVTSWPPHSYSQNGKQYHHLQTRPFPFLILELIFILAANNYLCCLAIASHLMYNVMYSSEWPIYLFIISHVDPDDIRSLSELNFQPTVRPPTRPPPPPPPPPRPRPRLPSGPGYGSGPFRRPIRRKRVSILQESGKGLKKY